MTRIALATLLLILAWFRLDGLSGQPLSRGGKDPPVDIGCALAVSLRPSNLDRDGPTVDPAEFTQPLHESGDPLVLNRALRWAREPNGRQLRRLLCARGERPRDRAANHRNELAALHVGRCPFLPGVTTQQPQGLLSHTQPATERTGKSLGQT